MITRTLSASLVAAAVLGAGLLVGCDDGAGDASVTPAAGTAAVAPAAEPLPQGIILTSAPEGAQNVADVKQSAKDGDKVVVLGVVGGGQHPFVDGRAAMTIVDPKLPSCAEMPDDACATPWDYCCEPSDALARNSATVQVAGPDGKPLRTSLRQGGIEPLKEVVVVGTLRKPVEGVAIIDAEGIYVK